MTTPHSDFYGQYCTHVRHRDDAVIHNGRFYVPTIWGQKEGNTVYVDSLADMHKVGGFTRFNEDQTEIHLTLPVGHKFGIKFGDDDATAALLKAYRALHDELSDLIESGRVTAPAWLVDKMEVIGNMPGNDPHRAVA